MKISFIKSIKMRKNDKNTRLIYIVICCFCIAISLIVCSFFLINRAAKNCKSDNFSDFINKVAKYECEYRLTVYSNKNINRYNVLENYEMDNRNIENFKFNFFDSNGIDVKYEICDNMIKISSSSQINTYTINDYKIEKLNLFSLSTFFHLYKGIIESGYSDIIIQNEEKDDIISISLVIDKNYLKNDTFMTNYTKIFDEEGIDVKKIMLEVNKKDFKPLKYICFTGNDEKTYFEVEYNKVNFN